MIKIRSFVPTDTNFILSSWLRSYKEKSQFARRILYSVYFQYHEPVVKFLIKQGTVLIAYSEKEPDIIGGYFCFEKTPHEFRGHYCYVRKSMRGLGLARALVQASGMESHERKFFTHWTSFIDEMINDQEKMVYNPYLI